MAFSAMSPFKIVLILGNSLLGIDQKNVVIRVQREYGILPDNWGIKDIKILFWKIQASFYAQSLNIQYYLDLQRLMFAVFRQRELLPIHKVINTRITTCYDLLK